MLDATDGVVFFGLQGLNPIAVMLGLLYGAAVYLVMNLVVLPMSAVAHAPIITAALLNA